MASLDAELISIVEEQKPMTVRQTFYQATVRGLVPKDEAKGYRVVQRRLAEMRRNGNLSYGWITDNVRIVRGFNRWDGVEDFSKDISHLYRRDYWRESDVQLEIWLEKDALAGVLTPTVVHEWGLDLHVARGFASLSYTHSAAESLRNDGRPAYIYILTDLDPSGIGISDDIESKLRALVGNDVELHVSRLAVTMEQVRQWNLPTRPAKRSDTRSKKFIAEYGNISVELDAIPPNDLRRLVHDAIAKHADGDAILRLKLTEQLERESINRWQIATGGAQ